MTCPDRTRRARAPVARRRGPMPGASLALTRAEQCRARPRCPQRREPRRRHRTTAARGGGPGPGGRCTGVPQEQHGVRWRRPARPARHRACPAASPARHGAGQPAGRGDRTLGAPPVRVPARRVHAARRSRRSTDNGRRGAGGAADQGVGHVGPGRRTGARGDGRAGRAVPGADRGAGPVGRRRGLLGAARGPAFPAAAAAARRGRLRSVRPLRRHDAGRAGVLHPQGDRLGAARHRAAPPGPGRGVAGTAHPAGVRRHPARGGQAAATGDGRTHAGGLPRPPRVTAPGRP